eukprot:31333-Pelagococcus_subviridis.AAC.10
MTPTATARSVPRPRRAPPRRLGNTPSSCTSFRCPSVRTRNTSRARLGLLSTNERAARPRRRRPRRSWSPRRRRRRTRTRRTRLAATCPRRLSARARPCARCPSAR